MLCCSAGTRLTTYLNPYLSNSVSKQKQNYSRDLWCEAASSGYLVLNASGLPYLQASHGRAVLRLAGLWMFILAVHAWQASGSSGFTFSTIDLTDPGARNWTKRLIRCNLLGDQSGCGPYTTASAPLAGTVSMEWAV